MNNIFALHLLKASERHYVMVDLKSGMTINGTLVDVDRFMNIRLTDAVVTNKDGNTFHRVAEMFVKGNAIKSFQLVEGLLEVVKNRAHDKKDKKKAAADGERKPKRLPIK